MFFKQFPKTYYEFKLLDGEKVYITDIFARCRFMFDDVFSSRPYINYSIRQSDTADTIAHDYYGSSDWWWLVLLYNDIVNPFEDMPRLGFDEYVTYTSTEEPPVEGSVTENPGRSRSNIISGEIYSGGNYSNRVSVSKNNPVAYLERTGGLLGRDFKPGDALFRSSNISDTAVTYNVIGNNKVVKSISGPEVDLTDTKAIRKIIGWNQLKRESILDINGTGKFSEGDNVVVIEKDKDGFSKPVVWGTIRKYYTDSFDSLSHFINNKTGARVSPTLNIQTRKQVNGSAVRITRENNNNITNLLEDTLIYKFLGLSGDAGGTYADNFSAITQQEKKQHAVAQRSRIKLLHPDYKFEALEIIKKLFSSQSRYEEYSSVREIKSGGNPQNIRGSGGTSTSRIY